METKHWIAATVLISLAIAETLFPFFQQLQTARERIPHDLRNLVAGAINSLLAIATISLVFGSVDHWATANSFGLLRWSHLPPWLTTCLAIIFLDIWTYWWHRINHVVPLLWRLHRTHHSDTAMDASTAVRFHTGELILSWMARLLLVPLLGISLVQLALYESLLLPIILFHHSNLRIPGWLDNGLRAIIVTPAMHRVHHSRIVAETNSNYGSLTPWWDRLFKSFRLRPDVENIHYGLNEFTDPKWQTLTGMARTPLANAKPEKPLTPEEE